MTKEIPLSQGRVALVDDEDFDFLNQWKWCYDSYGYAIRRTPRPNRKGIFMHHVVMGFPGGLPAGMYADHINHNGLDNRKVNLRMCTMAQNNANMPVKRANNTSGAKGVSWDKNRNRWHVIVAGRNLGRFDDLKEAALAYDKVAKEMFGKFAELNYPEGSEK